MYDDLRQAVQKLHDTIPHPLKKEAIGYVLQLFKMQDANPNALRPVKLPTRAEVLAKKKAAKAKLERASRKEESRRKAWETRRANAAKMAEKLME